MTPDELGQRRRRLGLSQAQLGKVLGVAGNTVARWERGELLLRSPELVTLALERVEQAVPVRSQRPPRAPSAARGMPVHQRRRGQGTLRHNLPFELTDFIGREAEVVEVRRLLGGTRLLTLTGAGGIGKTRLACQVARDVLADFGDGVWLVELAPLADAALVPRAVAIVLGVYDRPDRPMEERLVDVLGTRRLLLLLDNCEHLVTACAALVERLLSRCPHVRVLATSREQLGISGEMTWRVPSLSLPSAERPASVENLACSDAIRLFTQRAALAVPGFGLAPDNAPVIAQVCRRLDGIPLAIELAAARVSTLTVEQIASHVDDSLGLLTNGRHTASGRQRTLRATLDWSYDLLSGPERALLGRLAVFAGGWSLEAAEAVYADLMSKRYEVLDLLSNLVDKSLVMMEARSHSAWYRLLDPLRAYALEKLASWGDERRCRTLHRDWYIQLVERFEVEWRGERQAMWSSTLDYEQGNLRVALRFCLDQGDIAEGLRLASAVHRYWDLHGGLTDGRAWLTALLAAKGPVPDSIRAKALGAAGFLAAYQGDTRIADDCLTDALDVWRDLGNECGIASALISLGTSAQNQNDNAKAQALWEEGLAVARRASDRVDTYWALHMLARLAVRNNEYERAQALIDEGLSLKRLQGDSFGVAMSLCVLAQLHWVRGEYDRALWLVGDSLTLVRDLGHLRTIGLDLLLVAHIFADRDQAQQAACLFGAVDELQLKMGDKRTAPVVLNVDPAHTAASLARCRAKLAPAAFEAAWATGQAMTTDEAADYALRAASPGSLVSMTDCRRPRLTRRGLTPRETEVLRLVAGGNSNQQIASELVLSLRTVERHIANLYGKLGARNRADATAYALRNGIA